MSLEASSSYRTSFESITENELEVQNDGSPQMRIAKITSRGEEYFERYGGDDIPDPRTRTKGNPCQSRRVREHRRREYGNMGWPERCIKSTKLVHQVQVVGDGCLYNHGHKCVCLTIDFFVLTVLS